MRDTEREERVGAVLAGKYELLRVLGRGGMGAVYEARHRKTDGRYAVKLLRVGAGRDEAERMLREARALARLEHPHIVRLVDFDEDPQGGVFLVQELVPGRTLRALLDEELTLPPRRALALLMPVLDALAYAHARGVVHRDVKPENIVLREDASGGVTPKLVDFGLAREPAADRALTRPGATAGTPRYMSPEQAWGREDVDARSDVWSFGVVLYECLAGVAPYDGANDREVLASIVADDPPHLRAAGVGVDDALADAVMLALVRAPESRCPSAAELARTLAALPGYDGEPWARSAPDVPSPRAAVVAPSRPRVVVGVALAAIALAAAFMAVRATRSAPQEPPRATLPRAAPAPSREAPAPSVAALPRVVSVDAAVPTTTIAAEAPSRAVGRRVRPHDAAVSHGVNAAPIVDEI